MEECKCVVKEKKLAEYINNDIDISSNDSDEENSDEENSVDEKSNEEN